LQKIINQTLKKKIMNRLFQTFLLTIAVYFGFAQNTYLAEHFDYPAGDSLQNHGWYAHSAGTTNPILVHTSGLSWTQTPYIGSGVGNAAIVNNNGSDENKPLSSGISSGAAYTSFLLKLNGEVISSNRGYFFHMGNYANEDTPDYNSLSFAFRARTFVTTGSTAEKFRLGLTFNSGSTPSDEGVDMTSDLDTGVTYLVVIKYQFIDGDDNDEIFMYVFEDGDDISSEPATATLGPITGTQSDMPVMQYVALRQYNLNPNLIIDGIIVKDEWDLLETTAEPEKSIVNYWHFNTADGDLDTVHADYSNGDAYILYQQIDPMGDAIGRMDDVGGSDINARAGYDADRGIRPRNPSENGELLLTLNSEGFENLKLSYASERSGSGMLKQVLYISTDGQTFAPFGDTVIVATSYELVEFDLSGLAAANNNPNLMAKIRFFEQNTGTSGNNRFDNVVLEGKSIGGVYVPVDNITISPKEITFGIGDREQLNVNITPLAASNKEYTLVSSDETIVVINENEEVIGVSIGMAYVIVTSLDSGLMDTVIVNVIESQTVSFNVSDEDGNAIENAIVTLGDFDLTTDASGFADIQVLPGNYDIAISATGFIPFSANDISIVSDTTIDVNLAEFTASLIHYWHFNNLLPGNVPNNEAEVDYTLLPDVSPKISLGFLPEYTENTVDPAYMDDYTSGSALNAQRGEDEGAALRVRNRMEHRSLLIELPSTDVSELVLTFDVHRSGSGMLINHFEYSLDGGETWLNDGITPLTHTINTNYETKTVDLSSIEGANDNPDFVLRITYEGNIAQGNGNNRYDNIALFGKTSIVNVEKINAMSNVKVYPNPVVNNFTLELNSNNLNNASYTLINTNGSIVSQNVINNAKTEINTTNLSKGVYILLVKQGYSVSQHKIIVQ
jgi:hypothetical protein